MLIKRVIAYFRQPLYRNSIFLMGNTAATSGLGFIFWMIVARYYSESDVGLGAGILSAITLLASASGMGVDTTIIRYLCRSDKPNELINSALSIEAVSALVLAVIYIAGIHYWSPATGFIADQPLFIIFFVLFTIGSTISTSVDSILVALRRAEFVLFKNALISLLKLALPVLLVNYFRVFGIAGSWGISMLVVTAIGLYVLVPALQQRYRPVFQFHPGIIRDHWRYSAGNYLAVLLGQAPSLIMPIMTLNILGTEQNAYYYVAWMIGSMSFAVPRAIAHSLLAEGSHSPGELRKNVMRSLGFSSLILAPLMAAIILLSKWLLLLFGTNYSTNASVLLATLAVSSLFVAVNSIYCSVLRVRGKIKELVLIYVSIAVAMLVASRLLMPELGIVAAGYAWLGAQGIVSLYIIMMFKRRILDYDHGKESTVK